MKVWTSVLAIVVVGFFFWGNLGPVLSEEKAAPLAEAGLVAWWSFDETEGNTAADRSPTPHPAVIEGNASFVPGQIGNAVRLDGKTACLRVPGFKGITGTSPRSVAAWIKTSTAAGQIVSWGSEEPGEMWIFGFVRGRVGVNPRGGYLYVKNPLHDDHWYHVAVVMEEGSPPNLHDHVRLFINGEPAEIHDIGLLDLWPIDTGDQLDVTIGRGFSGLIDELRIYDRALTEDEIRALAKTGKTSQ